jgi:hypothetical protein
MVSSTLTALGQRHSAIETCSVLPCREACECLGSLASCMAAAGRDWPDAAARSTLGMGMRELTGERGWWVCVHLSALRGLLISVPPCVLFGRSTAKDNGTTSGGGF